MTRLEHFMLTAGGLGELRPASGTWGSLPPPAAALLFLCLFGRGESLSSGTVVALHVMLIALGVIASIACLAYGRWAEIWWSRKDPGRVVADEVAGQSIALLFLPYIAISDWTDLGRNILMIAIAFFAFRTMDIIKPPPARAWERFGGGTGILVDDLIAGLYALILTQVVVRGLGI